MWNAGARTARRRARRPLARHVTYPEVIPVGLAIVAKLDPFSAGRTSTKGVEGDNICDRAKRLLVEFDVRWLLIDKGHNFIWRNRGNEEQKIADLIVSLIEDPQLAMNVVVCGNEELMAFVERCPALRDRHTSQKIEALDGIELKKFVTVYEGKLGFATPAGLDDKEMLVLIKKTTGALRGNIRHLLIEAAKFAYYDDADFLTGEHLAKAFDLRHPELSLNPFREAAAAANKRS